MNALSPERQSRQVWKRREGGRGQGPGPCGLHGAGPHQGPASEIREAGTVSPLLSVPRLVQLGLSRPVQARQVPVPPEARGPPPLGGCHGDGAVYQLVAARHRRQMELSCEVRGPPWVPRNGEQGLLRGLPQRQSQPGRSLSLQQPRDPLGGAYTSQTQDADPERERGIRVMCRCRSWREPPMAPCFPQVCPHAPALPAIT